MLPDEGEVKGGGGMGRKRRGRGGLGRSGVELGAEVREGE